MGAGGLVGRFHRDSIDIIHVFESDERCFYVDLRFARRGGTPYVHVEEEEWLNSNAKLFCLCNIQTFCFFCEKYSSVILRHVLGSRKVFGRDRTCSDEQVRTIVSSKSILSCFLSVSTRTTTANLAGPR